MDHLIGTSRIVNNSAKNAIFLDKQIGFYFKTVMGISKQWFIQYLLLWIENWKFFCKQGPQSGFFVNLNWPFWSKLPRFQLVTQFVYIVPFYNWIEKNGRVHFFKARERPTAISEP